MPKAYWVTTYREIKDPAKLAAYAKLAPLALAPFGVRYLCRGNPNATYESGLKERLVVSEFPSLDKAIAGHDSPGYQEALRALGDGAVRDIRIIEGLECTAPLRSFPRKRESIWVPAFGGDEWLG
jgi:uncharacterized protein (DUF1330 family)